MRKFFSLIAAVLFAGSMMAVDFKLSSADEEAVTKDGVTVTFAAGAGQNAPKWYAAGLRIYAKNTITITSTTPMTAITFDWEKQGSKVFATATASTGSYKHPSTSGEGKWTGSATSVTFTLGETGQLQLNTFSVLLEGETPAAQYYLVSSIIGWEPLAKYRLEANPGQEGEYMIDAVLAANEGIKVVGVEGNDTTWYKDGMGNEYIIRETGKYTVYFRPEGNQQWGYTYFEPVKANCPLYNVAEAIAADPSKDDEMFVRGVVTKIEIKGSNFKTYGSATIYVKDATGATGEFEFYNSYSIKGAKYTTTDPAYNEESKQTEEFDAVSDGTYTVSLGDTVVAFGKYDYFETGAMHELQTNCFIVEIIEGEPAPVEPWEPLDFVKTQYIAYTDGTVDVILFTNSTYEYEYEEGEWQLYGEGDGDELTMNIAYTDLNNLTGSFSSEDGSLDLDYTYAATYVGESGKALEFTSGSVVISWNDNKDGYVLVYSLIDTKGRLCTDTVDISLYEEEEQEIPTAETTVDVTVVDGQLYADEGGFWAMGGDEIWVQLFIESATLEGNYSEANIDMTQSAVFIGEDYTKIYSATLTVVQSGDAYLLTGSILCYNNTQYNVQMNLSDVTTGIAETIAAGKAAKVLRNGQLLIMKGDKTFNMTGAHIR